MTEEEKIQDSFRIMKERIDTLQAIVDKGKPIGWDKAITNALSIIEALEEKIKQQKYVNDHKYNLIDEQIARWKQAGSMVNESMIIGAKTIRNLLVIADKMGANMTAPPVQKVFAPGAEEAIKREE